MVADLLLTLRRAGEHEQAAGLLARAAPRVSLHGSMVSWLLKELRAAEPDESAALLNRLPAAGRFGLFRDEKDHGVRYHFGREPDGTPAPAWAWNDVD